MHTDGLVVGFDLDMTLIDTRPGFAASLRRLEASTGVTFVIEDLVNSLGPPLDVMLRPYFPDDGQSRIDELVAQFRADYPATAIKPVPLLPGAREALAAVRAEGGKVVVVTGKYTPNAQLHLDHLELEVDAVVGKVWGRGKGPALLAYGASVYVGDHVHDVEGAQAAQITSVSVTTGGTSAADLWAAGTDVVLESLEDFGLWLRQWLRP